MSSLQNDGLQMSSRFGLFAKEKATNDFLSLASFIKINLWTSIGASQKYSATLLLVAVFGVCLRWPCFDDFCCCNSLLWVRQPISEVFFVSFPFSGYLFLCSPTLWPASVVIPHQGTKIFCVSRACRWQHRSVQSLSWISFSYYVSQLVTMSVSQSVKTLTIHMPPCELCVLAPSVPSLHERVGFNSSDLSDSRPKTTQAWGIISSPAISLVYVA